MTDETAPSPDEVRSQLGRMVQSATFTRAPMLTKMLQYVVEHTLDGDAGLLKEHFIAVDVFDLDEKKFDPNTDTIVRVQARRLRSKLEEYYAGDGKGDRLIIEVPKGHYAVSCRFAPEGAIFKMLSAAPQPLAQHLRVEQFRSLVAERTRGFVGRDFVFQALDRYVAGTANPEFRSGYIVIRGEPGIGKTALASQLVLERGYVHHFNLATQNIRSARDFLGNVCAQLVVRYGLAHPTLAPSATEDSGFLSQLLTEAARTATPEPVVVVVDALDEAEDTGVAATANRLFLPSSLPDGVFFIVTSREKEDYRLLVDRRRDVYLNDNEQQNLADVRQYVQKFLVTYHDEMMAPLTAWGIDEPLFVNVIAEKSQGNFMYLVFVLRDIRDGTLSKDNLDRIGDLPQGLRAYYQRHWRTMRSYDPARFEDYYEPVVCVLASAREPVAVAQLVAWTRRRWPHLDAARIHEVIHEWREFLNEDRPDPGPPLYRLYHTSFRDFLRETVGLAPYHQEIALTALDDLGFPDLAAE